MKPVSRSSVVPILLVGNAMLFRASERSALLFEGPPCGVPTNSTRPGQDFLCLDGKRVGQIRSISEDASRSFGLALGCTEGGDGQFNTKDEVSPPLRPGFRRQGRGVRRLGCNDERREVLKLLLWRTATAAIAWRFRPPIAGGETGWFGGYDRLGIPRSLGMVHSAWFPRH